jgi:hypothetical protein
MTACDIRYHHQGEAEREADGPDVGMLALRVIRDKFFHDYVDDPAQGADAATMTPEANPSNTF